MGAKGLWAYHCVLSKISFVAFADFHGVNISTVAINSSYQYGITERAVEELCTAG